MEGEKLPVGGILKEKMKELMKCLSHEADPSW